MSQFSSTCRYPIIIMSICALQTEGTILLALVTLSKKYILWSMQCWKSCQESRPSSCWFSNIQSWPSSVALLHFQDIKQSWKRFLEIGFSKKRISIIAGPAKTYSSFYKSKLVNDAFVMNWCFNLYILQLLNDFKKSLIDVLHTDQNTLINCKDNLKNRID